MNDMPLCPSRELTILVVFWTGTSCPRIRSVYPAATCNAVMRQVSPLELLAAHAVPCRFRCCGSYMVSMATMPFLIHSSTPGNGGASATLIGLVGVAVGSGVGKRMDTGVAVGAGVAVGNGVGYRNTTGVAVGAGVEVGSGGGIAIGVAVGNAVGIAGGVAVGSGVGNSMLTGVAVGSGDGITTGVAVGAGVAVGIGSGVG